MFIKLKYYFSIEFKLTGYLRDLNKFYKKEDLNNYFDFFENIDINEINYKEILNSNFILYSIYKNEIDKEIKTRIFKNFKSIENNFTQNISEINLIILIDLLNKQIKLGKFTSNIFLYIYKNLNKESLNFILLKQGIQFIIEIFNSWSMISIHLENNNMYKFKKNISNLGLNIASFLNDKNLCSLKIYEKVNLLKNMMHLKFNIYSNIKRNPLIFEILLNSFKIEDFDNLNDCINLLIFFKMGTINKNKNWYNICLSKLENKIKFDLKNITYFQIIEILNNDLIINIDLISLLFSKITFEAEKNYSNISDSIWNMLIFCKRYNLNIDNIIHNYVNKDNLELIFENNFLNYIKILNQLPQNISVNYFFKEKIIFKNIIFNKDLFINLVKYNNNNELDEYNDEIFNHIFKNNINLNFQYIILVNLLKNNWIKNIDDDILINIWNGKSIEKLSIIYLFSYSNIKIKLLNYFFEKNSNSINLKILLSLIINLTYKDIKENKEIENLWDLFLKFDIKTLDIVIIDSMLILIFDWKEKDFINKYGLVKNNFISFFNLFIDNIDIFLNFDIINKYKILVRFKLFCSNFVINKKINYYKEIIMSNFIDILIKNNYNSNLLLELLFLNSLIYNKNIENLDILEPYKEYNNQSFSNLSNLLFIYQNKDPLLIDCILKKLNYIKFFQTKNLFCILNIYFLTKNNKDNNILDKWVMNNLNNININNLSMIIILISNNKIDNFIINILEKIIINNKTEDFKFNILYYLVRLSNNFIYKPYILNIIKNQILNKLNTLNNYQLKVLVKQLVINKIMNSEIIFSIIENLIKITENKIKLQIIYYLINYNVLTTKEYDILKIEFLKIKLININYLFLNLIFSLDNITPEENIITNNYYKYFILSRYYCINYLGNKTLDTKLTKFWKKNKIKFDILSPISFKIKDKIFYYFNSTLYNEINNNKFKIMEILQEIISQESKPNIVYESEIINLKDDLLINYINKFLIN